VHDNEATEDMESDDTVLEINLDAALHSYSPWRVIVLNLM